MIRPSKPTFVKDSPFLFSAEYKKHPNKNGCYDLQLAAIHPNGTGPEFCVTAFRQFY